MSVLLCWHFFVPGGLNVLTGIAMKRTFLSVFLLFFLLVVLASCRQSKRKIPVVPESKLPKVQVNIHRYGKALFRLDLKNFKADLKKIKPEFLPFLNADLDDTANVNKLYNYVTDTQISYVYQKTIKVFPNLNRERQQLRSAFAHLIRSEEHTSELQSH